MSWPYINRMECESLAVSGLAFVVFAVATLVEGCRMCGEKIDNSLPSAIRRGEQMTWVGADTFRSHLLLLSYIACLGCV